jgi:HEAT repeat protein
MSLFANYRADRLIAEVKSSANPASPVAQKALEKLIALGPSAIDPLVEALTTSEKKETMAYVEALARLIDAKSLPHLLSLMADSNGRAMSGIAGALSSTRNYPAPALLDALTKPGMPKQALLEVIATQKARYTVRDLLNAAYTQEPSERSGLFKIIGEIADDSSVDDLISRIEGKDPVARLHIINVLGRFNTPRVQQAIQKQLKDNSKFIRAAY